MNGRLSREGRFSRRRGDKVLDFGFLLAHDTKNMGKKRKLDKWDG